MAVCASPGAQDPGKEITDDKGRRYWQVEGLDLMQCLDCGALASSIPQISHYPTCKPGESKFWEEFYGRDN